MKILIFSVSMAIWSFAWTEAWAKLPPWQEMGLNIHAVRGEPISIIHDMGATWVRAEQSWWDIEKTPGNYDFSYLDDFLPELRARGMKILFILSYAPSFHSSNGKSNGIPDMNAWKRFVDATTKRYADYVDAWEVWNEANLKEFFVGTPRQFVDIILKPAYPIIKKNDPDSVVASPGLATLYSTDPMDWLKKFKKYGGASFIDVVSHHAYASNAAGMKRVMTQSKIAKPSVLKMMQDTGLDVKPFWLTEYGCAEPNDYVQATCLVEQSKFLGTLRWVQKMFIYSVQEDRWGIVREDGTPKPAVAALRSYIKY